MTQSEDPDMYTVASTTTAATTTTRVATTGGSSKSRCETTPRPTSSFEEGFVGVAVYCFGEDAFVVLLPREVPPDVEDPIDWAMRLVVAGGGLSEEERADGYFSVFTSISADAYKGVRLSGSDLIVELDDVVQRETGFFTIAGGIWELVNQTGLQFPGVERVVLLIDGIEYCDLVPDLEC